MNLRATTLLIVLILCSLPSFSQDPKNDGDFNYTHIVGMLDSNLGGSSSLLFYNNELWTSNDHGLLRLFSLDTLSGKTKDSLQCGLKFKDMEEVTQDDEYFYFGDFGNNGSRLREDLRIYRVSKGLMNQGVCQVDTIFFTYYGYDPSGEGSRGIPTTDFDCESMVAIGDSLYLFSKQWSSLQTVCYSLPKEPGTYVAMPQFRLNVNGLVTGACYYSSPSPTEKKRCVLALCGYSMLVQPFIYLVYDFYDTDFTHGKYEKVIYSSDLGWQTEAIATIDGLHFWVTNENFSRMGVSNSAHLLSIDLSRYLQNYLDHRGGRNSIEEGELLWPTLAPNPTDGMLELFPSNNEDMAKMKVEVWDSQGRPLTDVVKGTCIDLKNHAEGVYIVRMTTPKGGVATRKILRVTKGR